MSPNSVTLIESCDHTVRLLAGRRKQCHAVCPSELLPWLQVFLAQFLVHVRYTDTSSNTRPPTRGRAQGTWCGATAGGPHAEAEGKNKAKRTTIIGYYCWTIIFGYIIIPLFPGAVSHCGLEQQGRMQNENPINKKGSAKVHRFV